MKFANMKDPLRLSMNISKFLGKKKSFVKCSHGKFLQVDGQSNAWLLSCE